MGWQTAGLKSYHEGITRLNPGAGASTLRMMLLKAPFDFTLRTYTTTASIAGSELTDVAAGYTMGVGGTIMAGARSTVSLGNGFSFDHADMVFTGLILTAGSYNLGGHAVIDTSVAGGVVLWTIPHNIPVPLDAVTAKDVTVHYPNATGVAGVYLP